MHLTMFLLVLTMLFLFLALCLKLMRPVLWATVNLMWV